jgi:hypothetical protein
MRALAVRTSEGKGTAAAPATMKLGSTNPAEAQLPLHLDWLAVAGFFLAGAMRALDTGWGL